MTRKTRLWLLILGVLVIDQGLKFWTKTHLLYGQEIELFGLPWALIRFEENNGMAFGMSFGGRGGKLALSLFRIFAVSFLGYYLFRLAARGAARALVLPFALIVAGALGNIIDSVFYGVLFSASTPHSGVARFLPAEGGYESLLFGRVVDMFYFPVCYGIYPDWVPLLAGRSYLFFRPVFNVADLAIFCGVIGLCFFYYRNTAPAPAAEEE